VCERERDRERERSHETIKPTREQVDRDVTKEARDVAQECCAATFRVN
jgi:hypothetical protein